MSGKITQKEINNIVWKACDTFRGVIDPSQYKDYILTMLFLKYVSDVHKDLYRQHLERYKGDQERAARAMKLERFVVPQTSTFEYLYENRNFNEIGQLGFGRRHGGAGFNTQHGEVLSEKIVATGGETVDQGAGFKAGAAMNGIGWDDEGIARPDLEIATGNGEAETAGLDEG
jgi:hypothetical protein